MHDPILSRREILKSAGIAGLSLGLAPGLIHAAAGSRKWPNIPQNLSYDPSKGDSLAQPWSLAAVKIKNRIVKSAMGEARASPDGFVTEAYVNFYGRLVQGGVGLMITGNMYTQPVGVGASRHIVLGDDDKIPGLEKVAQAVHRRGGIIFAQINDAGSSANLRSLNAQRRAPSAVLRPRWRRAREMNEKDIDKAIRAYGRAALRVQKAGFDGVEIHAAHGYLISQFLDPKNNLRTDLWGGSLENRHRFALEVYKEVRSVVGKSFPVIVKINGDLGGQNPSNMRDQVILAQKMDELGVDGFDVSCGGLDAITGSLGGTGIFRENRNLPAAIAIKGAVTRPVFVVGGIREPECMRIMVQQNYVDAVSMARPFLRDPDFPRRILEGPARRSGCLNTNQCFLGVVVGPARCWNVSPDPFGVSAGRS